MAPATAAAEALRARLKSSGKPTPDQLQELQRAKEQFQETESSLAELERRRKELLDRVPNPPADDVPSGGEDDFDVLREVGTKPSFGFAARDHLDLAQAHGWIDAARGTKVSGSRFIYRIGDLALLELALYRYALARVTEKGHIPILPPVLVREEAMYGTGFFPTDAVNIYGVERDELYLVGTSEVPVAAFHAQRDSRGAAPPLRRVLDVLQAGGRRSRQGHARHVPCPPVRQGGDVRVLRARGLG